MRKVFRLFQLIYKESFLPSLASLRSWSPETLNRAERIHLSIFIVSTVIIVFFSLILCLAFIYAFALL